jgi:ABC-2 type transport system ATP-binding protein
MGDRPGEEPALPGAVVDARQDAATALAPRPEAEKLAGGGEAALEVEGLSRSFGTTRALSRVSLQVRTQEVHALLGPNGAGKTTLLRVLAGLVDPDAGEIQVLGRPAKDIPYRSARRLFGVVPSGDRSFYLRMSGLENLVFFARLHGLRRARALERAWECLEAVGLADVGRAWVGTYSHGMHKRLSVARALLTHPAVLLVDEATHDLDPEGARRIRALVSAAAEEGAGVIWATQRVEEIRGFADRVTLLHRGEVRFAGSVARLIATSPARRYLLHLQDGHAHPPNLLAEARAALAGSLVSAGPDPEHLLLALPEEITLGEAVSSLVGAGLEVLACREEGSGVEEAFLSLTQQRGDG